MSTVIKYTLLIIFVVFFLPVLVHAAVWLSEERPRNWHSADWSSAGTLPPPRAEPEASIRVMAARTGGLKGIVAVHTWLVLKHKNASAYERYEVVGWGNPVRRNSQPADGRWYSNDPVVIHELKGPAAERLLPMIEAAIRAYHWSEPGAYRIWPGPNSNTFVANILAAAPELGADMPPTAIGKDFPTEGWVSRAAGGGWAISLGGFASLTIGWRQGIELNLLGLVAGIRFHNPTLILPGFGALGEPF